MLQWKVYQLPHSSFDEHGSVRKKDYNNIKNGIPDSKNKKCNT